MYAVNPTIHEDRKTQRLHRSEECTTDALGVRRRHHKNAVLSRRVTSDRSCRAILGVSVSWRQCSLLAQVRLFRNGPSQTPGASHSLVRGCRRRRDASGPPRRVLRNNAAGVRRSRRYLTLWTHESTHVKSRLLVCETDCQSKRSSLRNIAYRMGSHSVTCHPAEVTFSPLHSASYM